MKFVRTISRRSFLAAVGVAPSLAACASIRGPIDENPYDPPAEPRNVPNNDYGRAPPCVDGDRGRHADPPGLGRRCNNGRRRRH